MRVSQNPLHYQAPRAWLRLANILVAVGCLTLAGGLFAAPRQTWGNVLLGSYYLVGLGLGGLVFIALQHVTGAGWAVAFRRLPEALADLIPVAAVGIVAVLVAYPALYPWTDPASDGHLPNAVFRHLWLNRPFVVVRALGYLTVWIIFARAIVRASVRQDDDGSLGHTDTCRRLSAAFLVVFGLTCWLSSVDWVMSLEPQWSSTIFGVYQFSGMFLSGLAAVSVLAVCLQRQGALRGIVTQDHLHDLGTLLFSFSSFWMYIWFSQYMLIWYVNNPEETAYFIHRLGGGWRTLFYLNVLVNWVVPFLVLMPRAAKRSPTVLLATALVLLGGRWLDLYLTILPPLGQRPLAGFGILESGLAAGALGLFLFVVLRALGQRSLVPFNDPYLVESLPHPASGAQPASIR